MENIIKSQEKALIVWAYNDKKQIESIISELKSLINTAGGIVIDTILQYREFIDNNTVIGSGKLQEIGQYAENLNIDIVIFENDLTPTQLKNIQNVIPCKVIDRTTLILDIFALHANTAEGKLQVELAQLEYNLPRLIGSNKELSRLGGGIGTRGPGESKLETDKRHIRNRIYQLKQNIKNLEKQRDLSRKRRQKMSEKVIAIVGYTNAGKSSLLNCLSSSDVYVADKLFATLDPTARKIELFKGISVIFIDTVGFIQNIPTTLIAAFKSTLEEAAYADLILNVCDISDEENEMHKHVTIDILNELGCKSPILTVYSKCDLLGNEELYKALENDIIMISSKNSYGIDNLKKRILKLLFGESFSLKLKVPYSDMPSINYLHKYATIIKTDTFDDYAIYYCNVLACYINDIKKYII